MKPFITPVLLLITFCAVHVAAADRPSVEDETTDGRARWEAMAAELNLTEEQKAEIAPILKKQAEDLRALREDTSLRRLAKARKARAINEAASQQIRARLTPEQQETYDELRAAAREKLKQRLQERKAGDASG